MLNINDTDLNGFADCPKRAVAKIKQRGLSDVKLNDLTSISPSAVISIGVGAASKAYIKILEKGTLAFIDDDYLNDIAIARIDKEIEKKTVRFGSPILDYAGMITHTKRLVNQRITDIGLRAQNCEVAIPVLSDDLGITCHVDFLTDNGEAFIYMSGQKDPTLPLAQAGSLFVDSEGRIDKVTVVFQKIHTLKRDLEEVQVFEIDKKQAIKVFFNVMNYIDRINEEDSDSLLENPNSMLCSERYCPAYGTDFCNCTGG